MECNNQSHSPILEYKALFPQKGIQLAFGHYRRNKYEPLSKQWLLSRQTLIENFYQATSVYSIGNVGHNYRNNQKDDTVKYCAQNERETIPES